MLSAVRITAAQRELVVCGVVGLAVGVPVALTTSVRIGVLVGWDAATAVYLVWLWVLIWPSDSDRTAQRATTNDPSRAVADLILLTAAVASLVAVGFVLTAAGSAQGAEQVLFVVLGLASVVLAWAMVHTVYTLRYARLYYGRTPGGVDFNDTAAPAYTDFAYLAFTVGMTFQVSDTSLQSNEFRRTALRHALLSFVFGTGILATSINLVASLVSH
jgi:uncharacterized membrane protein